jgi:hypothetical protein
VTASRLTTIFCDEPGCGTWLDAGVADTAAEARAQLARYGWQTAVRPDPQSRGTLDYCPAHRKD